LEGGALLGALLAVFAVILASVTIAFELVQAAGEALKWAELLVVFLFAAAAIRRAAQVYSLLATLLVAGMIEAAIGLFQFATGTGPAFFAIGDFLRAYGTFGQPNPFAGYLATIVPLAVALLVGGRAAAPGWLRALALLGCAVLGAAILSSLSRGTWLSLALALLVMLLVWEARTRRLLLPALLLAVALVALVAVGALPPVLTERLGVIVSYFGVFDVRTVEVTPENFAVVERMAHWQAGWYMFLDHPILGVGAGNYAAAYSTYFLPGWPDPLGHAHNYYLNTAAETGLVGLAALLWLLGAAYRVVLRGLRRAPRPLERAALAGVLGSLVTFTAYNAFDNLLVHGVTMQLGLLFALACAAARGLDTERGEAGYAT
jgi:O-antigen ligase